MRGLWPLLFLAAALIVLVLLPLFQKGTFIDGQLYKTVAFNDALNAGSFWSMKYTNTCMQAFCEQPPLYPYLLSTFYQLFGTHYLVDRFFTLALLVSFLFIIRAVVASLFDPSPFYYRLFVFFMLAVPVWCWSYANQVIEPLVCICIAIGIYSFLKYLRSGNLLWTLVFALSLYASFLAKGFQSCFLIVLPLGYALLSKLGKKSTAFALMAGLLLAAALVMTRLLSKAADGWFACYYKARLVLTMQNVGSTTDSHSEIIIRFFTELIVPLSVMLVLFSWLSVKKKYPLKFIFRNFAADKLAVSLLLAALAGSLPYAVSLVQRGFYLVPSFVCFLLSILSGFRRYWLYLAFFTGKLFSNSIVRVAVGIALAGSVAVFALQATNYKRDEELLTDLEKILPYLHEKDTLCIKGDMWNYFNLHSYLYMAKQVSLADDQQAHGFVILSRSQENADSLYVKLDLDTKGLDLFRRKVTR